MAMSSTDIPLAAPYDEVFPSLTEAQLSRVESYGHRRFVNAGEVLIDQGDASKHFFIILNGEIEAVSPAESAKCVATLRGRGQFTGEINTLTGRRAILRVVAKSDGELIELDHRQLMDIVQSDSEIGETIMRAFIWRRVAFARAGIGDVILLGSVHSGDTLRLKEFLTRNGHPYAYLDLDRDAEAEQLMLTFKVGAADIPVVICRGKTPLRNPTNRELADCLGFNESINRAQVRDVVVIGAGPAGLAAAVYAASEGLDVLVVECNAPGGQAGSSSKIENYLGFPTGVSGQELAARAFTQAEKFGAEVLLDRAIRLHCDSHPYRVETESGSDVPARALIIATGVQYRKPALDNLERFEGNGIYYGATFVESQLCSGDEVIVVGGGNSAGQAAVFLSKTAERVYVLVRSNGLAQSMSRYLSRRIEETPNIELRTCTEIVELNGTDRLESVRWRNLLTGETQEHAIPHVFMMTGAEPNTHWLDGCLMLDEKGFVKTGPQLTARDLADMHWSLSRLPQLFETTLPGVFAVGDIRDGSIKRVASAVGEGSITISFVHQFLAE